VKSYPVAGIIDVHGGLRVVVGTKSSIIANHQARELIFIVPGFRLPEPVPWHQIPGMWRRVECHIDWWMRSRNDPEDLNHVAIVRYRQRIDEGQQSAFHLAGLLAPPS
jgi:hypothetical protein